VGLRNLQTRLEVFAIQVQDALLKKFGTSLDKIGVWFEKNGPMMAARIADVVKGFLELAEKVVPAVGWIVQKFMDLDKATDGASTKAALAVAAFTMLGGASVVSGILGAVKAVGMLGGALMSTAAATSAAGITSSLGALAKSAGLVGAAAAVGYAIGTAIYSAIEGTKFADAIGEGVAQVLAFFGVDEAQVAVGQASKRGSPSTVEKMTAAWGKSGAELSGEAAVNAHLGTAAGSKAVTVNQTTNINVNGGEAASTGKAVARSQDRVNEDIVRNLSVRIN